MRALIILLLVTTPVWGQAPSPGDELLDKFGLAEIRPLAGQIAKLRTEEPLDEASYAAVIQLRARHPVLARAGVLEDAQLEMVALALCPASDFTCVQATQRALRCLADRCAVALDEPPGARLDMPMPECVAPKARRRKRAPLLGVGFDWGSGIQRSGAANEGRANSFGISARLRFSERFGFVARVDHTDGRDEATDADRDGADDFASSAITRLTALAGPSIVLDSTKFERSTRSVRLDLLGGYLATKTLPGEDGIAVGADLALQLSAFRTGIRLVQGLGDASRATNVLVHFGITVGATPTRTEEDACPAQRRRSSRLGLGFELPIVGGGFSSQLGLQFGGFGTELVVWHLDRRFDVLLHADLLAYPRREKERVIAQAALAGLRFDHGPRLRRKRGGWYSTLMGGYQQVADLEPSSVGDGPIVDASVAWGAQDDEFAGYIRLHGRLGLAESNEDYRALFLSFGFELRFDRDRWSDRDRVW